MRQYETHSLVTKLATLLEGRQAEEAFDMMETTLNKIAVINSINNNVLQAVAHRTEGGHNIAFIKAMDDKYQAHQRELAEMLYRNHETAALDILIAKTNNVSNLCCVSREVRDYIEYDPNEQELSDHYGEDVVPREPCL